MLDKFIDGLIAELPRTELSARQHEALLAALVDQRGIGDVLETLARVCADRAYWPEADNRLWLDMRRWLLNVVMRWDLERR